MGLGDDTIVVLAHTHADYHPFGDTLLKTCTTKTGTLFCRGVSRNRRQFMAMEPLSATACRALSNAALKAVEQDFCGMKAPWTTLWCLATGARAQSVPLPRSKAYLQWYLIREARIQAGRDPSSTLQGILWRWRFNNKSWMTIFRGPRHPHFTKALANHTGKAKEQPAGSGTC